MRNTATTQRPTSDETSATASSREPISTTIGAPELPALTLPKGGGALRGLGEKLVVGPSGTASFSVPIMVSPGRSAATTPQVALTYESGAGNSPFGLGWSLLVPAITRKTEKRLPRYHDGDESDTFVLAGVEDLVPALVLDGSTWRPDVSERDGFRIARYRPRIENAFARIERWTELATDTTHWRITSGDNVTTVFGASAGARLADPADPSRVFEWRVERVSDDRGNICSYEYVSDDRVGIDGNAVYERNRGANNVANIYLKRIRYANQVPFVAGDWHLELVLDYGDHDPSAPRVDADRAWPVRLDPFSRYRAGFDVRTYRLCRRILMFHAFAELGDAPQLVRAVELVHDENPTATTVGAVIHRGYAGDQHKALPALELAYTANAAQPALHVLASDAAENLPAGLARANDRWVDLDGEGLAGVLTEQAGAWFYKRNLGGGTLGALEHVATVPNASLAAGAQLLDLESDGRKYVVALDSPAPGYFRRTDDGWSRFAAFESMPVLDWNSSTHRLLDLDGDGRADVLITEHDVWSWHPSLGTEGFAPREPLPIVRDEERGPVVVFSDPTSSIVLGDFSGDGLVDIARIRNGEVCYWPNLGYGRFGAKVTMAAAPVFDHPEQFDPRRLRLADVDGSGTTDLVYLGADSIRWWRNDAGNAWSELHTFDALPSFHSLADVQVLDLLGNGTSCVVWSSSAPADAGRPLAYLDLMNGQKPYLLASVRNNLGVETTLRYAASTDFYVADRLAGQPWATKLPFPVQVVVRSETADTITGTRFVTTYSYHHGYYDPSEQELRGFGRVDQIDAESYDDERLDAAPVLTKSWYHTGAYVRGDDLVARYRAEYWAGDPHPQASWLGDAELPAAADPDAAIEATRALKGQLLRREVYALDGGDASTRPFVVTMHRPAVRRAQPGVHFAHGRESLVLQYERAAVPDPRATHTISIEIDDLGSERRTISIAYPRRDASIPEQAEAAIVYSERDVAHVTDEPTWYRIGVPVEMRRWHVTPASVPARYGVADVDSLLAAPRRLVDRENVLYRRDDLSGPLPSGAIESLALRYENYVLALTPELVAELWAGRVTDAMLVSAGYVLRDSAWWVPSGQLDPEPARFYQPVRLRDAFGNVATVEYDAYALLAVRATSSQDPVLASVVTARNDYRTLSPVELTDPNGCRTQVALDELGLVVALAVDGPSNEGDTLADPTTRYAYDFETLPVAARTRTREQHQLATTRWLESFEYSDGFGRLVQKKAMAEPDPDTSAPRWIGSGRTVWNNKGLPVKQYEPFFSTTSAYETESALVASGVTPLLHYDPVGRVIETELPDGSLTRVEFDPWHQRLWDRNDTALEGTWHATHAASADVEEQRAAQLAAAHAGTPNAVDLDPLGRIVRSIADCGPDGSFVTRSVFDIDGRELATIDQLGRTASEVRYDLAGRVAYQRSLDGGERWTLSDVAGKPVRAWDARGHARRMTYDALQRPTHAWVMRDGTELLVERTVWGEHVADATRGLRTRIYQRFDGAGVSTHAQFDWRGNLTRSTRVLAASYRSTPDWSPLAGLDDPAALAAAAAPLLEAEVWETRVEYDALGRATRMIAPDASEAAPEYNEAGKLERLVVALPGAAPRAFVSAIHYNARGQRSEIRYDSGVRTTYQHDEQTSRLRRLVTTRTGDGAVLQDLAYVYDPVGNVVAVGDGAQQTIFFSNAVVSPVAHYTYDPLYRLIAADGREHIAAAAPIEWQDATVGQPHPNDGQRLQRYTESYRYDAVGNLLELVHAATSGSWTRSYAYAQASNQLGGFAHDAHGNMTTMPHLAQLDWNERDELCRVDLGGGGTAYYTYDANGQRARKVIETLGGLVKERLYLGSFEVYRERRASEVTLARTTLHVLDDARRIALVETLVRDDAGAIAAPTPVIRYQLANHLESASLELDAAFAIVSYEEFHPWGTTSYQAGPSQVEVSLKRYRYTAKERDEETGLYYHGARYYAPWLGRWTAVDPLGGGAESAYVYVRDNPIALFDPSGAVGEEVIVLDAAGYPMTTTAEIAAAENLTVLEGLVDFEGTAAAIEEYNAVEGLMSMVGEAEAAEAIPIAEEMFLSSFEVTAADATAADLFLAEGAEALGAEALAADAVADVAITDALVGDAALETVAADAALADTAVVASSRVPLIALLLMPFVLEGDTPKAEPEPEPAPKPKPSTYAGEGGASSVSDSSGQEGGSPVGSPRRAPRQEPIPTPTTPLYWDDGACWDDTAHANSYRSCDQQYLYVIESSDGEVLKYGTTRDPDTRYTDAEMAAFGEGARMVVLSEANVRTIRLMERQLIKRYGIVRGDEDLRPPFNRCYH